MNCKDFFMQKFKFIAVVFILIIIISYN